MGRALSSLSFAFGASQIDRGFGVVRPGVHMGRTREHGNVSLGGTPPKEKKRGDFVVRKRRPLRERRLESRQEKFLGGGEGALGGFPGFDGRGTNAGITVRIHSDIVHGGSQEDSSLA